MNARVASSLLVLACASVAIAQPIVTEIMYDPASGEPEWEWLEVFNPGAAPLDLDDYYVDRVGDHAHSSLAVPQIRSSVHTGTRIVLNPTVVPAGGVAVLYNGDGLEWEPQRFRDAWPQLPGSTPLIGVDGWSGNALANSPAPPEVDESLPGLTLGFWATPGGYLSDTANLGTPVTPDERVVGVSAAAFSFSYDDTDSWPDSIDRSSIAYDGAGPTSDGASWSISAPGLAQAYESAATFLGEPINGDDVGSPGAVPAGSPAAALTVTEIMYNPESVTGSREWEWVEVYNAGASIDFSATPHWLDDDDGSELDAPNVTSGTIGTGGVGVLFNADATDTASMQQAWGAAINFIPVEDWSGLNNTGDVVGLWNDGAAYVADHDAGGTVAGAAAGVVFDDSSPWPSDNGFESIWLKSLSFDPQVAANWSRSLGASDDPNAVLASDVFAPGGLPDNSGEDIGSPGLFPGAVAAPLAGDFNGDGRVDAADYTRWRDGGPLLNETASPGSVDSADYAAWAIAHGSAAPAIAVPEPLSAPIICVSFAACGCRRICRRV